MWGFSTWWADRLADPLVPLACALSRREGRSSEASRLTAGAHHLHAHEGPGTSSPAAPTSVDGRGPPGSILQDALGIAFCLYTLKTIRLPTFKVRPGAGSAGQGSPQMWVLGAVACVPRALSCQPVLERLQA